MVRLDPGAPDVEASIDVGRGDGPLVAVLDPSAAVVEMGRVTRTPEVRGQPESPATIQCRESESGHRAIEYNPRQRLGRSPKAMVAGSNPAEGTQRQPASGGTYSKD